MTLNRKPIIALTVRGEIEDLQRSKPIPYAYEWVPRAFAEAVVAAGAIPLLMSNGTDISDIEVILARVQGLLLTGGEDVDPAEFGEQLVADNVDIRPDRDKVELAAIAIADRLGLPILGVCRGIQVLNIARGGTIWQDLQQQYERRLSEHTRGGSPLYRSTHRVEIAPDSQLAAMLGVTVLNGVTSHHQAIKDLGRDLRIVGSCPDDEVIEAVEQPGERFCVGVQWHPEIRNGAPETDRLFAAFVAACRAYAQESTVARIA